MLLPPAFGHRHLEMDEVALKLYGQDAKKVRRTYPGGRPYIFCMVYTTPALLELIIRNRDLIYFKLIRVTPKGAIFDEVKVGGTGQSDTVWKLVKGGAAGLMRVCIVTMYNGIQDVALAVISGETKWVSSQVQHAVHAATRRFHPDVPHDSPYLAHHTHDMHPGHSRGIIDFLDSFCSHGATPHSVPHNVPRRGMLNGDSACYMNAVYASLMPWLTTWARGVRGSNGGGGTTLATQILQSFAKVVGDLAT
jgi:hypothetical protein